MTDRITKEEAIEKHSHEARVTGGLTYETFDPKTGVWSEHRASQSAQQRVNTEIARRAVLDYCDDHMIGAGYDIRGVKWWILDGEPPSLSETGTYAESLGNPGGSPDEIFDAMIERIQALEKKIDYPDWLASRLGDEGMTQRDLAEKCGLPQQRISDFVRGDRTPRLDQMEAICAVLGPYEVRG